MSKVSTYAVAVTKTVTFQTILTVEAEDIDSAYDAAIEKAPTIEASTIIGKSGPQWFKTRTDYNVGMVLDDSGKAVK